MKNYHPKYKNTALDKFNLISKEFGTDGIKVLSKYGEDVALNKNTIGMISKYGR